MEGRPTEEKGTALGDLIESMGRVVQQSPLCQVLFLFPTLVLLTYVVGLLPVWGALFFSTIYYLIHQHRQERAAFDRAYTWTLQTLVDKRNELPSHASGADETGSGVGAAGETHVVESLVTTWWRACAKNTFTSALLPAVVDSLNATITPRHGMIDHFTVGSVHVPLDEPPKVLALTSHHSSYNSTYMDMKWEYQGALSLSINVVIRGTTIPVEISDIRFLGSVRLETIFPQTVYPGDGIACKEQEAYTMALSLIDEYLLDFHVTASKINLTMLPSLRRWIQSTIYQNIRHVALWPHQVRLFGPPDHLHAPGAPLPQQTEDIDTAFAQPLEQQSDSAQSSDEPYLTGIMLFFPEGENNSPPPGYELIDRTCTGAYAANLNSGDPDSRAVYLCVKTETTGAALTDIGCVRAGKIEADGLPDGYRTIHMTSYGEDAYVSEGTPGEESTRLYMCYEKAAPSKGVIRDLRVMFDEEIPRVRDLKAKWTEMGVQDFPVGYTILTLHTIPQTRGPSKKVFLCFYRDGGTALRSLVEPTAPPSEKGRPSIRNTWNSLKTMASQEVKQIQKTRNDKHTQRLESVGITPRVLERAKYLSNNREIFTQYPLDGHGPKEDFFSMTEKQQAHALEILKEMPSLNDMRLQLAPAHMSDSVFWYIYFSFIRKGED